MKIRALTIHMDPLAIKSKLDVFLEKLVSSIIEESREMGLEVWTIRLAITPQTLDNARALADKLEKLVPSEVKYITIPLKAVSYTHLTLPTN